MTTVMQPHLQDARSGPLPVPSRSRSLLSIRDLSLPDIAALMQAASFLEQEDPLQRAHRLAKR
ncbi:MAG TPA: hypothetical protein VE109_00760, partial [Acidobacteriaceae bacterium]|nr:hypothetical protein [Acidobacteriaceae bacterium]